MNIIIIMNSIKVFIITAITTKINQENISHKRMYTNIMETHI